MKKTRFDLGQALSLIKEGNMVKNIKTNTILWFDFKEDMFWEGSKDNGSWGSRNMKITMSDLKDEDFELYRKPILLNKEKKYLESVLSPLKKKSNTLLRNKLLMENMNILIFVLIVMMIVSCLTLNQIQCMKT